MVEGDRLFFHGHQFEVLSAFGGGSIRRKSSMCFARSSASASAMAARCSASARRISNASIFPDSVLFSVVNFSGKGVSVFTSPGLRGR